MNESRDASVHALVGVYAIDALEPAERARFETHLARCEDCQTEVTSLREVAALLGGAEPLEPPRSVRGRVLAGIGAQQGADETPGDGSSRDTTATVDGEPHDASGETADDATNDRARDRASDRAGDRAGDVVVLSRRRFRVAAAVAAAAVVAAVGAGVVVVEQLGGDGSEQVQQAQPTLAERVQRADDVEQVDVELGDGGQATVFRSTTLERAVVVTEDMPALPAGKVYELWFDDRQNGFTPAGLMSTTPDQTLVLEGNAARATRVGITVEPAGGSRVPTSEPIAVFPFESEQA